MFHPAASEAIPPPKVGREFVPGDWRSCENHNPGGRNWSHFEIFPTREDAERAIESFNLQAKAELMPPRIHFVQKETQTMIDPHPPLDGLMKGIIRSFALVVLVGLPAGPPGVPEACCGYSDCRKTAVRILSRSPQGDTVKVEGKILRLGPGALTSRSSDLGTASEGTSRSARAGRCRQRALAVPSKEEVSLRA